MPEQEFPTGTMEEVDAVTGAVLTASRLLVAVSARSLSAAGERVTLPQFRMLLVLSTRGATETRHPRRLVAPARAAPPRRRAARPVAGARGVVGWSTASNGGAGAQSCELPLLGAAAMRLNARRPE